MGLTRATARNRCAKCDGLMATWRATSATESGRWALSRMKRIALATLAPSGPRGTALRIAAAASERSSRNTSSSTIIGATMRRSSGSSTARTSRMTASRMRASRVATKAGGTSVGGVKARLSSPSASASSVFATDSPGIFRVTAR